MCLEGQDALEEERIYLSEKNVSHAHGVPGKDSAAIHFLLMWQNTQDNQLIRTSYKSATFEISTHSLLTLLLWGFGKAEQYRQEHPWE